MKHIEKGTLFISYISQNSFWIQHYLFGKRNEEFTVEGDALVASEVALETASEAAVGLGAFEKSGILILAQDDFDDGFDTFELEWTQKWGCKEIYLYQPRNANVLFMGCTALVALIYSSRPFLGLFNAVADHSVAKKRPQELAASMANWGHDTQG